MKHLISIAGFLQLFSCSTIFAQGYCIPAIVGNTIIIDHFAFHTLLNNGSGGSTGNYRYYPDSIFTTEVNIGETYPITIANEITAGIYGKFHAWIDYNNDSIFSTSEKVFYDTTTYGNSEWGFVTIPYDTSFLGKRRMRVICTWPGNSIISPCIGGNVAGEAEDYEITITNNAPHIPTYCYPFYFMHSNTYAIDDFQLNTISNINTGCDSDSYIFYPDSLFTTTLLMNTNYPVFITGGFNGQLGLYIDLDNNGHFTASERFVTSNGGPYTGTINIPLNPVFAGLRRLRVINQYGGGATVPYGLSMYGEAEDYTVTIAMPTGFNSPGTADNKYYQLFPNPVTDHINFLSLKNNGQPVNVIICTQEGKQVYQNNFFHLKNSIDVAGLAAGIYSITILNDSFTQTSKFVKL